MALILAASLLGSRRVGSRELNWSPPYNVVRLDQPPQAMTVSGAATADEEVEGEDEAVMRK